MGRHQTPGELLRDLMFARDMSTERLAEIVGVSQPTISQWRSGRVAAPRLHHIERAERALNVEPGALSVAWGYAPPRLIEDRLEDLERDVAGLKAQVAELRRGVRQPKGRQRPASPPRTRKATPDAG